MHFSLIIVLLTVTVINAVDLRTITCNPYVGKWNCWYNQTCGNALYECKGEARDAPPFTAVAFGWVIFGCVTAILIVLVLIGVSIFCICMQRRKIRKFLCCD